MFPSGEKYQLVKSEGKLVVMVRLAIPVLTSVTHLDNKGQLVDEKIRMDYLSSLQWGVFHFFFL